MIELQWLERAMPRPKMVDDEFYIHNPPLPDTVTVRVLQYRQRVWVPSAFDFMSDYGPWSDWIDVPTVPLVEKEGDK